MYERRVIVASKIEVERLKHESGIYIIFNKNNYKIYIGKAVDLRRRMEQHVRNLFAGCDNHKLQQEFSEGRYTYRIGLLKISRLEELDKEEIVFFQAAVKTVGRENIYNIQELKREKYNSEAIEEAKNIILNSIHKRNIKGIYTVKTSEDARLHIQDWIDKSNKEILELANEKIISERQSNKAVTEIKKPELDSISIIELYNQNKMDAILVGVMGEYIGDKVAQEFTDILAEKLAHIACYGRCMWAGEGPNVGEFKSFQKQFGIGEDKKIYLLFSLTGSKYEQREESYYFYEQENSKIIYRDTAPKRKSHHFKGLVIDRFWTVEEEFVINQFYELYYRYERKTCGPQKKPILNNDIKECIRKMQLAVSKKAILNSTDIQKELMLTDNLYKEFIKEKINPEIDYSKFPTCSTNNHPTIFILAEVLDYVWMKEIHIEKGIRKNNIRKIVEWTNAKDYAFLSQYAGDKWDFPLSENQVSREKDSIYSIMMEKEFIGMIQVLDQEKDTIHIGRFLLNPAKTGKGIGTEALNNFCKILFDDGKIEIITLNVAEFNKSAQRCCEKCGFIVYDERYKNGNRTLKMRLVRTE